MKTKYLSYVVIVVYSRNIICTFECLSFYFFSLLSIPVKTPNPPVNITLSTLGSVIMVTWSPPPGHHLPISSYKLCYQALPASPRICIVVLANRGDRFIINTKGHEGQVFAVTMTSRIGKVESENSSNKYHRAREEILLFYLYIVIRCAIYIRTGKIIV